MYSEEEFLQLSALQHFVFCPRQCALIHIEQSWVENQFTAEGRIMHENTDEGKGEKRAGIKIVRGLLLSCRELGLNGKADVVEFHKSAEGGKWKPFPIEYKRGKPKADNSDKIQLCAQALCLEEMLKTDVPFGALFYGKTRRRLEIEFSPQLREETKETIYRLHDFINKGWTPKPVYGPKCKPCSFIDICIPKAPSKWSSVQKYLVAEISEP